METSSKIGVLQKENDSLQSRLNTANDKIISQGKTINEQAETIERLKSEPSNEKSILEQLFETVNKNQTDKTIVATTQTDLFKVWKSKGKKIPAKIKKDVAIGLNRVCKTAIEYYNAQPNDADKVDISDDNISELSMYIVEHISRDFGK